MTETKRNVKDYFDSPLMRLAIALKCEGFGDVAIGCELLRVYPWADPESVVSAVLESPPWEMPAGWRRGMFMGKPALAAIKAAEASVRRRDHGHG